MTSDNSGPLVTRRTVLSTTAVGVALSVAGCGSSEDSPDVVVRNGTDEEQTAQITAVAAEKGAEMLSENPVIESDGSYEENNIIPTNTTVIFNVAVEDGPSGEDTFDIGDEGKTIEAEIKQEAVEFNTE